MIHEIENEAITTVQFIFFMYITAKESYAQLQDFSRMSFILLISVNPNIKLVGAV
jgi:hypothetical protein